MIRTHKLPLAIALVLASSSVHALGLGAIELRSGLNEPLVAEIPLIEAFPGEATDVRVGLAKAEDFARVGLDLSAVTVPLAFDLISSRTGSPRIQVSSEVPVREPFLSFLVEVSWPNGRLLREYSVLLDPPDVAPAVIGTRTVVEPLPETAPAAEISTPESLPESSVVPSEPAADASAESVAPPPAEPLSSADAPAEPTLPPPPPESPAADVPAMPAAPTEYGPVASGETLWEIAQATRPSDAVTLNQMMVAILRMNPDAFAQGNVNQLKRGAVLRIPAEDEARAITVADAAAEIAAQNQAWQAARGTTLVADAAFDGGRRASSVDRADDSRLELVPPRSGDGGRTGADRPGVAGGTDAALQAELKRAREQLASREQESSELRSRVAELERIQRDNERLVNLKNSEIAELQRRLEAAERAAAAARQTAADAEARAATPPPTVTAPPPATTPEPASTLGIVEAPTPPAEPVETAEPLQPSAPADATGTSPTPETAAPVDESTPATEVLPLPEQPAITEVPPAPLDAERPPLPWWRQTWIMAAIGGAIVLIGLLLFLVRGRRKVAPQAEGRVSVADSFGSGVFSSGASAFVDAGDDDSERQLLHRLAADPTDLDAHLDLLRHYYALGDTEKFEAAASGMYAQVSDPAQQQWQDALMLGRTLLPDNPLFVDLSVGEGGPAAVEAAPPAIDLDGVELAARNVAAPAAAATEFDFSLEAIKPPTPTAQTRLDTGASRPDASAYRTQEMESPIVGLDSPRSAPTSAPPPQPQTEAARSGVDGFFDGEDPAGTKLDLARAYLDMGDPEGARSMLQEVITEGSEAQRSEARRLLAEIG